MRSHSVAQAEQISAHTSHVFSWWRDPRSMKFALNWQISAQSINSPMWSADACSPPIIRQWLMVSTQTL